MTGFKCLFSSLVGFKGSQWHFRWSQGIPRGLRNAPKGLRNASKGLRNASESHVGVYGGFRGGSWRTQGCYRGSHENSGTLKGAVSGDFRGFQGLLETLHGSLGCSRSALPASETLQFQRVLGAFQRSRTCQARLKGPRGFQSVPCGLRGV